MVLLQTRGKQMYKVKQSPIHFSAFENIQCSKSGSQVQVKKLSKSLTLNGFQ